MNLQNAKLGIIGGGNMARAILRGIIQAGLVPADAITVSDLRPDTLAALSADFSVTTTTDNCQLTAASDIIILAVKPQTLPTVLAEIAAQARTRLFLSIAAGVRAAAIHEALGCRGRIVRIMPNVAAQVLAGASAISAGPDASDEDLAIATAIFDAVGSTVQVAEPLMDAVTGLSGSGPAYLFLVIEALADAGVRAGLPRTTALQLAAQTCSGAAQLVLETGHHPAVLKDQVTSPGGTTIAGMHRLEQQAVRGAFMDAVAAAVDRAPELGA